MGKRRQDRFGKQARAEGYPARSVYKLEEIDQRISLFRRGQRVLDLGGAPGSWALYAAQRVGSEGHVLSVDLQEYRVEGVPNLKLKVMDARALDAETMGLFDRVISDMAPKTTGQRDADQYRSFELFMLALEVADAVLKPGGHFVAKIFQGAEFEEAREALRARYASHKIIRPKATRDVSYELFLVGSGKRDLAGEPHKG